MEKRSKSKKVSAFDKALSKSKLLGRPLTAGQIRALMPKENLTTEESRLMSRRIRRHMGKETSVVPKILKDPEPRSVDWGSPTTSSGALRERRTFGKH